MEPRLRELERAALTARGDGDAAAEAEALAALGNEQGKLGMFGKARETIEKLLALATAVDDGAKQSFACGALAETRRLPRVTARDSLAWASSVHESSSARSAVP